MTANMTKLTQDAKAAGYSVREESGHVYISKNVMINQYKTRVAGIVVYADGTAIRLDVDLAVASGMRSYKAMRAALGI
jgi:hypothetical protein